MRAQTRRQIAKGSLVFTFALTLAASGYSQTRAEPIREHKHETPAGQCELSFQPIVTTSSSFKGPWAAS